MLTRKEFLQVEESRRRRTNIQIYLSIVLVNEKAVTVDISTKEDEEEKPLAMGVAGMNFMVLPLSGDSDD